MCRLYCVLVALWAAQAQAAEPPWWSGAVYYNVLVDSFKDSNGDGLGDLNGVTKQLSYVRALGADAVILSPVVSRSTDCATPGTLDFADIDRRYGDLETFNALLEKASKIELKVVVTLPLQTISTASEWFNSSAAKTAGFEDWVVWKEGSPDNVPETEDGATWTWHETRAAFYASNNNEALVNLCSEAAGAALSSAQCAWIRRGVAGILLNPDFMEQRCGEQLVKKMAADAMSCARGAAVDAPVILVESSLSPSEAAKYYSDGGGGANTVFSRALTSDTMKSTPELALELHAGILNAPDDGFPTWLTSANDSRIATRYGNNMVDAINLLALILPGSTVIKQGDELGAADTLIEWAASSACWPQPFKPSSAPFPWDDTTNAGFSSGEPWMPLAPNYRYANAKTEFANDFSHVGVVKMAAALRKSPAMGPHTEIHRFGGAIAVLRWGGGGSLLLITNMSPDRSEIQLSKIPGLSPEMTIAASTAGSSFSVGSHLNLEKTLKLGSGEAVLLAGPPRHCGGPGPVDKITNKLAEGWQKINKYFSNL